MPRQLATKAAKDFPRPLGGVKVEKADQCSLSIYGQITDDIVQWLSRKSGRSVTFQQIGCGEQQRTVLYVVDNDVGGIFEQANDEYEFFGAQLMCYFRASQSFKFHLN